MQFWTRFCLVDIIIQQNFEIIIQNPKLIGAARIESPDAEQNSCLRLFLWSAKAAHPLSIIYMKYDCIFRTIFFLLLFSCWLVFSHTAMRGRSLPFVRLPKGFHLSVQIVRAEKLLWFFIYECLLLRSFISSIWRLCAFGIAVVTIREHTKWNKIVYVVWKFLSFIRDECEYEPNGGRVWTCVYCLRMRSLWMSLPSSTQAFEEFLHCLLVGRIQQQMRAAIFRSATSTATR